MHIQEAHLQEAVNYLLGIAEQDVNPAFKGHAKEWMRDLRESWLQFQTAIRNYGLHEPYPQKSFRVYLEEMREPANCLASVLSVEAKERLLNYLKSS